MWLLSLFDIPYPWKNLPLGGGNSKIFDVHPYLGKMSQFDYIIFFKMGWFNHQLVHQIRNDLGVEFVSFTASLDWKVISEETVAYTLRGSD